MDASTRQRAEFLDARRAMEDTFKAAAAEALETNSRRFLPALEAELNRQHERATAVFDKRQSAVDDLLKPIRETLGKLDQQSREMESKRDHAYGSVREMVESIQQSHRDLRTETTQLVSALRKPEVRGHWGELQLRRCIEFAGMVQHCDFEEQSTIHSPETGALRPDVVIHLPNRRVIAVDAKVPLMAFSDAALATTAEDRERLLAQHSGQLRRHLSQLESKAYGRALEKMGSPDLVVCFLPSEVLLSAALDADPSLITFSKTVVLATPTTLIALLKAIECGWQQMEIAQSAQQIRELAREIYTKTANAHGNLASLGMNLRKAVDCYNDFLTKVEGKGGIFSLGRKLRELKVGDKELPDSTMVENNPRIPYHSDWDLQPGLSLAAQSEDFQPN